MTGARPRAGGQFVRSTTMSSTTSTSTRVIARWAGPALVATALVYLIAEAIIAHAWDQRPYSYIDDYVSFLGSPFVGEFDGVVISSPLWWLMTIAWIVAGTLVASASIALSRRVTGWRQWAIPALDGITGIHEWPFTASPTGVHVATNESFAGAPIDADAAHMQELLDGSLQSWLAHLKAAAGLRVPMR